MTRIQIGVDIGDALGGSEDRRVVILDRFDDLIRFRFAGESSSFYDVTVDELRIPDRMLEMQEKRWFTPKVANTLNEILSL
jgi:hypothetical protein